LSSSEQCEYGYEKLFGLVGAAFTIGVHATAAGRDVLIWPDNDEAGAKYAYTVAAILSDAKAKITIIDGATLAATLGTSDADGFDAADALAETNDVSELQSLAVSLDKPFPKPAYRSFGPYTMDARGLHVLVEVGRGDNKHMEERFVSAPFEIVGACRDLHGGSWGNVIEFRDADGRHQSRHIPDATLHGEAGSSARRSLIAD
jgi:putative DNA primase/helicase